MKKPKKETRDVIAKHVRWTEALRVVRAYHPEVTIILPEEKMQLLPGDDGVPLSLLWWASSVVRSMRGGAVAWLPRHAASGRCGCFSATTSIITRGCIKLHFSVLNPLLGRCLHCHNCRYLLFLHNFHPISLRKRCG